VIVQRGTEQWAIFRVARSGGNVCFSPMSDMVLGMGIGDYTVWREVMHNIGH